MYGSRPTARPGLHDQCTEVIIVLQCGHLIEREGSFFNPTELCPVGDGWQSVNDSEALRIADVSLSDEVSKALDSAKPVPPPAKV